MKERRKHYLINVTWRCPNAGICRYCWVDHTIRQRPELLAAPERPLEDWVAAIQRDAPDVVDIAGGEPFIVNWLADLMLACPDVAFGLSTNGLYPRAIEKLADAAPTNLISVNMSYHPDGRGRYKNYDKVWRESIRILSSGEGRPAPNIVDYKDTVELSADAMAWMNENGINYVVSPYEDMDGLEPLQEQGLCCQGGIDHLTIAPDGSAWPCLTTLRSPYWRETCLGNWLDGELDLSRKPQPCHLYCLDHYVLEDQHSAGDMWGTRARPCEGE